MRHSLRRSGRREMGKKKDKKRKKALKDFKKHTLKYVEDVLENCEDAYSICYHLMGLGVKGYLRNSSQTQLMNDLIGIVSDDIGRMVFEQETEHTDEEVH